MSAFIVTRSHIDALVSGLISRKIIRERDADAVGLALWKENHKSVNALYRERTRTPKYAHSEYACDAATLLKEVRCYVYQSCERAGWATSAACAWMLALELALSIEGVTRETHAAAYEAAPWGLS